MPSAQPRISVAPEFIQGVIPGADLVLLVTLVEPDGGPVGLSAEASGATVTVTPPQIAGTEVAEVVVVPGPTAREAELAVTITAQREGAEVSVTRQTTVVPWEDDRGDQAAEVLGIFTRWLGANRPELAIDETTAFSGTFIAPLLLVVSHYGFTNDDWEIGLSWHIMVPPDDFAEIYLRPRAALAPTLAFRVASWQTALSAGNAAVTEVAPPPEVVR